MINIKEYRAWERKRSTGEEGSICVVEERLPGSRRFGWLGSGVWKPGRTSKKPFVAFKTNRLRSIYA